MSLARLILGILCLSLFFSLTFVRGEEDDGEDDDPSAITDGGEADAEDGGDAGVDASVGEQDKKKDEDKDKGSEPKPDPPDPDPDPDLEPEPRPFFPSCDEDGWAVERMCPLRRHTP